MKGNTEYPTKEEILKAEVFFKKTTIETVHKWKKEFYKDWKNKNNKEKIERIERLINEIAKCYPEKIKPPNFGIKDRYCYSKETSTIYQNPDKPSIISGLHEFTHHLYGSSEFKACRWSIWLFKKCFEKDFNNLEFSNHLLVQKNIDIINNKTNNMCQSP